MAAACTSRYPFMPVVVCQRDADHDLTPGSFHRAEYGPLDEIVPGIATGHPHYRATHTLLWAGSIPLPDPYADLDPPLDP